MSIRLLWAYPYVALSLFKKIILLFLVFGLVR